jgi:hypothetical protein
VCEQLNLSESGLAALAPALQWEVKGDLVVLPPRKPATQVKAPEHLSADRACPSSSLCVGRYRVPDSECADMRRILSVVNH